MNLNLDLHLKSKTCFEESIGSIHKLVFKEMKYILNLGSTNESLLFNVMQSWRLTKLSINKSTKPTMFQTRSLSNNKKKNRPLVKTNKIFQARSLIN